VNQGQRSHGSRALPADGHTADDDVYTMVTQLHLDACVVDEQGKSNPRFKKHKSKAKASDDLWLCYLDLYTLSHTISSLGHESTLDINAFMHQRQSFDEHTGQTAIASSP
jgi:hypothetical protein